MRWAHFRQMRSRAAQELVEQAKRDYPDTMVTVLLPRRMYSPLADRLLHDRTADKMARVISRDPWRERSDPGL